MPRGQGPLNVPKCDCAVSNLTYNYTTRVKSQYFMVEFQVLYVYMQETCMYIYIHVCMYTYIYIIAYTIYI